MFDLYLFNTIVNTIWYIFTILFVLYRFTSLFSYIYNFSRFCGKLFTGVHHIYTYTKNANRYQNIDTDIESQSIPKSAFQKFKEMCKKKWYQLFNKSSPEVILKYETVFPLVETTTLHNSSRYPNSSEYQNSSGYRPNSSGYQPNSSGYQPNSSGYLDEPSNYSESNSVLEKQLFDRKIDELMDEDSLYYDPNYQSVSLNFDPLHAISDKMDELDKEEKRSLEKLGIIEPKSKKIRFNAEYESSISESSISEYKSDSESEPLFHKQLS
jgi:hypothetical protein